MGQGSEGFAQGGMGPFGNLRFGQFSVDPGKGRLVRERLSDPKSQDLAQGRLGLKTLDQRADRGLIQDRLDHEGPRNGNPVVGRTP